MRLPVAALAPEEMADHFGGLGFAVATDFAAKSAITRQLLPWRPTDKPSFIADIEQSTAYEA